MEKEKKELAKNKPAEKKTDGSKPKELDTPLMNQAEIESNMPEYEVYITTPPLPPKKLTRSNVVLLTKFNLISNSHDQYITFFIFFKDTFEDYLEMFIQFGYVVLFSSAFPLAALCALLNNVIEIRSDAFKLCTNLRRPFGEKVENIGTWQVR